MLIAAKHMLLPDHEQLVEGWLQVEGEQITQTGLGRPPQPADEQVDTLAPGYVDVHVHGGGGAAFSTEDPAAVEQVLTAHRSFGTTTMVASLVTGRIDVLERQVRVLAEFVADGRLGGIHLEGPWLAQAYKGAHPPELLTDPLPEDVDRLIGAGAGAVKMVTIAPERLGANEAISRLADSGCVVAVGHTAAGYEQVRTAIEAGARGATHLFNAMPPLKHRDPGPILALWEDDRVFLELILDGAHVRPELVAFVIRSVPGRVALITDAMAAAAAPDGDYVLGELDVEVRDRIARLAGTQTIAGSTLTLDRAVRNAVEVGVPAAVALRAASTVPADYLGLDSVGRLAPGKLADLVVLDADLNPVRVLHRGRWV